MATHNAHLIFRMVSCSQARMLWSLVKTCQLIGFFCLFVFHKGKSYCYSSSAGIYVKAVQEHTKLWGTLLLFSCIPGEGSIIELSHAVFFSDFCSAAVVFEPVLHSLFFLGGLCWSVFGLSRLFSPSENSGLLSSCRSGTQISGLSLSIRTDTGKRTPNETKHKEYNITQVLSTKTAFFRCKKRERQQKKKEAKKRTDKELMNILNFIFCCFTSSWLVHSVPSEH